MGVQVRISTQVWPNFGPCGHRRRLGAWWLLSLKTGSELLLQKWSRLVSNQRPSACEADALPLSYETRETPIYDRWTSNVITHGLHPENLDHRHRRRPDGMVPPMTLRAGLLTLLAASVVLCACGGQSSAPASTSSSLTRLTTTEDRSSRGSSSEVAETGGNKASPTTEPEAVTDLVGFTSPSGNVGCYLDSTAVRCDISERDWIPPPRPSDCEFDYGQGINLSAGEAPNFVCAGDTALGGGSPLAYGQSVSAGALRCESAETGITCIDSTTNHGFSIARERYKLF